MSQITVYAGAIMVLFLFVIMLLGAESLAPTTSLPWQKPMAFTLAAILVVESLYLLISRAKPDVVVTAPDIAVNSMDNLREMAMTMFNQFLLPFEVTSILLLVAMVGAIVLTNREKAGRK
ncbi:NADH-quinone oxidoreductase subunit J [Candidatus Villigracilis saccharophilus]|uniref:NADH-quinone oxidoreductase subunit J family protein n=1 Tax=Candidatus Villigracilis saccharophilus TaxID=3140684 RepID=UPI0031F1C2A5